MPHAWSQLTVNTYPTVLLQLLLLKEQLFYHWPPYLVAGISSSGHDQTRVKVVKIKKV